MAIRELKRYYAMNTRQHTLVAIDIENDPKTGDFICAGVYGEFKGKKSLRKGGKVNSFKYITQVSEYFTSKDEFQEYLLSLKKNSCVLVFYNLSYDKVFLDEIIATPSKKWNWKDKKYAIKKTVLCIGTRVISCELKNGLKCIDLFNHTMEGSLADWIKYLDMTEKYGIAKAELKDYYNRVMNDVKATWYLGFFIQDFYNNECNVSMQLTVGATALKMFTKNFFTDYWQRDDEFMSVFERQSYYGGRTELFRRGQYHHHSYDINSTYLSVMRDELIPDMSTGRYVNSDYQWEYYLEKYLCVIHCRIYCPPAIKIPILPVKMDKKLKFPTGYLEGTWTSVLLKKALAIGYEMLEVFDFVFYKKAKRYFKEFAEFIWERRVKYKTLKNKGMDSMVKRIGNSLYGKFAQRNSDEILCRLADYPETVPEGSEILEYKHEPYVLVKGTKIPASFEFPAVASFITSYAQLKLYNAIEANADNIIYCDTDSIKVLKPAVNILIGNELGEWKFEYEKDAMFYRPKFYDEKHKGVPKTCVFKRDGQCTCEDIKLCTNTTSFQGNDCNRAEIVEKTDLHIKYRYDKPIREREAIRRNLIAGQWHTVEKTLTFLDDKRCWHKDGTSEPIFIREAVYASA